MTFETLIDELRLELDDTEETRWTDDNLLLACKRGVRRLQAIIAKHELTFGKFYKDFNTAVSTADYAIGSGLAVDIADFGAPIQLYRTSTDASLHFVNADVYTRLHSVGECKYWMLYDGSIYISSTPSAVIGLRFWYWPMLTQTITTSTTVPYGDKLPDLLIDYVAARQKNIDEMNVATDMQLLTELESKVLGFYQNYGPTELEHEGPMGVV